MIKIAIFGTGYVGLVTGACLAHVGHRVTCVDIDHKKVEGLNNGCVPIHEPGLEPMVKENHDDGRLHFTTDAAKAIAEAEIIFIAVGTPPEEDGSADLTHVLEAAGTIGDEMRGPAIVVNKSTVPVGTADRVHNVLQRRLEARGVSHEFEVVSNPEFLKEGAAVEDCLRPDRIIVGTESQHAVDRLRKLYEPFNRNHDRVILMDVRSAELTKYAANAMLATKISFMNEVANIAENVGADIEMIRRGIGSDPRIGWHFIYPGAGFGGSCFPKDVRALAGTARDNGVEPELVCAVESVNNRQKRVLFEKLSRYFSGNLEGRTIAIWGLAFKPNTDDMREASSLVLIQQLVQAGARIQAYDPVARRTAAAALDGTEQVMFADDAMSALQDADALAIVTEWTEFRAPDFEAMKRHLASPVIFDGRNLYRPEEMFHLGFHYESIGRRVPQ